MISKNKTSYFEASLIFWQLLRIISKHIYSIKAHCNRFMWNHKTQCIFFRINKSVSIKKKEYYHNISFSLHIKKFNAKISMKFIIAEKYEFGMEYKVRYSLLSFHLLNSIPANEIFQTFKFWKRICR